MKEEEVDINISTDTIHQSSNTDERQTIKFELEDEEDLYLIFPLNRLKYSQRLLLRNSISVSILEWMASFWQFAKAVQIVMLGIESIWKWLQRSFADHKYSIRSCNKIFYKANGRLTCIH